MYVCENQNLIAMHVQKQKAALTCLGVVLICGIFSACKKEPEPVPAGPIYMEPVTEIDGNVYQTVKIGNQVWMAENLKTTHYRNGDPIPHVTDNSEWYTATTDGYCNYGNLPENAATYGHLYTWHAAMDSRKLAPEGWRIPSPQDFEILKSHLGDNCGVALKEAGTLHWFTPNEATNSTGFAGLPGGERSFMGGFEEMGNSLTMWTNLETNTLTAKSYALYHHLDGMSSQTTTRKACGFSVRCIKE